MRRIGLLELSILLFGVGGGGCHLVLGLDEYSLNTCLDGVRTAGESDVDCGGPCAKCADNAGCFTAADCASGVCVGGACAAPSCSDGEKNGDEESVDCGGKCGECGEGGGGAGGGSGGAGGAGGMGGAGGGSQAICGDGIVTPPEVCDDSNTIDGDKCSSDCNCLANFNMSSAHADADTGHCYVLYSIPVLFFESINTCANYGMYLATVTTLKERLFVGEFVGATTWIGGFDIQNEGEWNWVKGIDPWTIYPCDAAQPGCDNDINLWNNGGPQDAGNEDCLALYLDTDKFSDLECSEEHQVLCEKSP